VLADLFATVEAAAKQQTGNKKVTELEQLVAKLEKFETQREAEIRQKDAIINELRQQGGDEGLRASLEAAQREVRVPIVSLGPSLVSNNDAFDFE
jgi:hypothetical protein